MRSKALCLVHNGHSAPKPEKAVLEYLGQFSDPEKVREYLVATERRELEKKDAELQHVEKRLADFEADFLQRVDDLLKRKVLTEQEVARANETAREQVKGLETRKAELTTWLGRERARVTQAENLPQAVKVL